MDFLTPAQVDYLDQHLTDEQKVVLLRDIEFNTGVTVYDTEEDFNDLMASIPPLEVVRKAYFGKFQPNDEYFTYYGDWIKSYATAQDAVREFWDKQLLADASKEDCLSRFDFVQALLDEME